MSSPATVEDVMKKIRDLEAGEAYIKEEMSLLNIWARIRSPRSTMKEPERPIQNVVTSGRPLEELLMEEYYMNILESMGQAVFAYDLDLRVFYWNQHSEKLFDCPREDALGNDILSILVNPNLYDAAFGIINGVKQGASWTGQFPIELQMGKKLLIIVSVDPFYDDDGTLVGLIAVAVDSKPFFEIKYSVSESRYVEFGQSFCRSRTILTSTLGLNPEQPLQTAIASKLTTLATKVSNKVWSKMKIGERDVSGTDGSGDSHFPDHDEKDDESPIDASTPLKDSIRSAFGVFFKGVTSQRDSNDEGEGKNTLRKLTSKAEAWIQKKIKQ